MLLAIILLSTQLHTASPAPVVEEQIGCAEGEPLVGMFLIYYGSHEQFGYETYLIHIYSVFSKFYYSYSCFLVSENSFS